MEMDAGISTRRPWLVSLLSGKGGVGKSIIAFNLAALMARKGNKTLIIDADWHFGNQHLLANAIPGNNLIDIIDHDSMAASAVVEVGENLHLLASPSVGTGDIDFEPQAFARLMANIRSLFSTYDFIIIDTPSGLMDLLILVANSSDTNLIVLNPELTSIADAYGLFKYLIKSNNRIIVHLLINRAGTREEYKYIYRKLSIMADRFLGKMPLDGGYLLEDKYVIESVAAQKAIIESAPETDFIQQLSSLGELLISEKVGSCRLQGTNQNEDMNSPRIFADIRG